MQQLTDIIYIAGYGRSGSTLLEKLLQCQPAIRATGELANYFTLYNSAASQCSCGEPIQNCVFWSRVAENLKSKGCPTSNYSVYDKIQKKCEAHWSHRGVLPPKKSHYQAYAELMKSFFDALDQAMGTGECILVDSSKTAYARVRRPAAISALEKYSVRVIHLVRDCRGVAWSIKKGLNRRLEAGMSKEARLPITRAMIGWAHANITAGKLKDHLGQENYYLLRYEDLADSPVDAVKNLESFLGINLEESVTVAHKARQAEGVKLQPMHQLAGNRMRFNSKLTIAPDYQWQQKLDRLTANMIKYMLWPLMKKYGYI
jgi:hypothetical protein